MRICFFVVLAVPLAVAAPSFGGPAPPYRLTPCYNVVVDPAAQIFIRDMEGDGNDELVVAHPDLGSVLIRRWAVDPRDPTHLKLHQNQDIQVNLTPPGVLSPVMGDVTGEGRVDLFVISRLNEHLASSDSTTAVFVTCYAPAKPLCTLGPFLRGCSRRVQNSVGLINVAATTDVNGDSRADILLFDYPFSTGCEARGLRACDARSGEELWRLDMPTPPGDVLVLEQRPGGHRSPLLVVGAHACGNGFQVGDWSDSECCVTGVSSAGSIVWRTRMGGEGVSTRLLLADRDSDGEPEPYVALHGQQDADGIEPRPRLFGIDPATGSLAPFDIPDYPNSLTAVDLDGRRGDAILLVGRDQILYALGRELETVWTFRDDRVTCVIDCRDLDGDSRSEILCDCGDILRILDARGREVAQTVLSGTPPLTRAACASIGGYSYLVVRQGHQLKYLRLERLPRDVAAWVWILGTSLVFTAGLAGARAVRAAACREFDDLLWGLRHGDHENSPYDTIEQLRQLVKSWQRVTEQGGARASRLPGLVTDFKNRVVPVLIKMARLGPRTGLPRALWAALGEDALIAHELLDGLIAGAPADAPAHAARAARALHDLQGQLSRLETRFPSPARPKAVAETVLERRRPDLQRAGVTVEIVEEGAAPCRVELAPHELDQILDNCVENSLRALAGRASPHLAIVIAGGDRRCTVEIRDNGSGLALPPAAWDTVFLRGVTSRAAASDERPGGFGLSRARQVLKRYRGQIEVVASAPGAGTTLRLTMRAARRRRGAGAPASPGLAPPETSASGG